LVYYIKKCPLKMVFNGLRQAFSWRRRNIDTTIVANPNLKINKKRWLWKSLLAMFLLFQKQRG